MNTLFSSGDQCLQTLLSFACSGLCFSIRKTLLSFGGLVVSVLPTKNIAFIRRTGCQCFSLRKTLLSSADWLSVFLPTKNIAFIRRTGQCFSKNIAFIRRTGCQCFKHCCSVQCFYKTLFSSGCSGLVISFIRLFRTAGLVVSYENIASFDVGSRRL